MTQNIHDIQERKKIKIKINDNEYEVLEGMNIVEACDAYEIPLERFCYHRYLPVDGNCRTCMVEIETPRGRMLTIGCNTKVQDGMVIYTNSENAIRAQKSALEFLLLDHPLDCPICDKAGECSLQDNYMDFGRYDFRRIVPRYFKKGKAINAGDHIVLDQERCILCTRCIRFLDNITQTSELGIIHRGHASKISTYPGKPISNDYSGNITDICPVGALTLKEFRFKQRVWFLKKTKSICVECARGCSITMEQNFNKIWRFMPRENPHLNRVWICDKGRFSFKKYHENRLWNPILNQNEIDLTQATLELENVLKTYHWNEIGWILGPYSSMETLYIAKKYFGENVYALIPPATGKKDELLQLPQEYPNEQGIRFFGMNVHQQELQSKIEKEQIKLLFIVEIDIYRFLANWRELIEKIQALPYKIYFTSFQDETSKHMDLVIPVRSHAEIEGTYINATSLLQKSEASIEPENSFISSSAVLLSQIAYLAGRIPRIFSSNSEIYNEFKNEYEELKQYSFSNIPDFGIKLSLPKIANEPFQGVKVDFNIFMIPETQLTKMR
ncbi:MAG: 2Fe-2S iron-sulfur cluster-binding protein [Leptospiraceae bacterium]|nr:2Fe-2S iron-sulfur cluster-binding protein [Leptospiraceae bacterium]MDW7975832.1 2Fe-2S iron-sulfur cluster-binding protein [Leptospiraceae bacterium]